MNAPPRKSTAPAVSTASAVSIICRSDSTEHGPAMTENVAPPKSCACNPHRRWRWPEFATHQFVRCGNPDYLFNARRGFERFKRAVHIFAADGTEHYPSFAGHLMHVIAELAYTRANVINLFRGDIYAWIRSFLLPLSTILLVHRTGCVKRMKRRHERRCVAGDGLRSFSGVCATSSDRCIRALMAQTSLARTSFSSQSGCGRQGNCGRRLGPRRPIAKAAAALAEDASDSAASQAQPRRLPVCAEMLSSSRKSR